MSMVFSNDTCLAPLNKNYELVYYTISLKNWERFHYINCDVFTQLVLRRREILIFNNCKTTIYNISQTLQVDIWESISDV